jgi:hypothetical protein
MLRLYFFVILMLAKECFRWRLDTSIIAEYFHRGVATITWDLLVLLQD